ncbi:MAG: molybdopterin-dependent oxidoreductase [Pseudonocardia sp.]|nr:molybdopterin-dependent oxidoreductase [Pseudonocardia sp.]
MVVVDPRRTRTARADEHLAIRPGTDALLLAALAQTLFADGLVASPLPHGSGVDEVAEAVAPYPPETVAAACGIPAATIRRLAHELAAAPSAAVYGRIGTCTTAFGTVTSWLVDVLNVLTGNLDRPGGVLFPMAEAGGANTAGPHGSGRGVRIPGSRRTRVRGLPSALGELPVAARIPDVLRTPSGTVELAPPVVLADAERLVDLLAPDSGLVLVGRRDVRSNNSWMHNLPAMVDPLSGNAVLNAIP